MSSDEDKNFQKKEENQENSRVVTPESDGEVIQNTEDSPLNDKESENCIHIRKYQPDNDKGKKDKKQPIMSVKCIDCIKCEGNTEQKGNAEDQDLWLCMQCLYTRCGRYSTNTHSLKHYEAENSHCLTFSFNTWQIWCYKCDAFVDPKLVKGKLESVTFKAKEAAAKNLKRPKSVSDQSYIVVENKQLVDCKGSRTKSMRVIGLYNLGNTCYFNSALQNLLYLRPFREQLHHTMTRTKYKLVPEKHPDLETITFAYSDKKAEPGKLAEELFKLIKETAYQSEATERSHSKKSSKKVITPRSVQNEIGRKHRKFSNGSQQDSHELLRILIDIVKDEEIKRLKAAFLDHFDIKDHKSQFKNYPEDKKKLLRKYASEFKNVFVFFKTFIDDTFGGKMISTVNCLDCGNVSDTIEHFLDISLSLPVPVDSKKGKVRTQPQNKKLTSKQQRQLNKAEKKNLKKKSSKKMDLQTFQSLETSNTGRETENIELKNLNTSNPRNDSRSGEEGIGDGSNVKKSENSPEQDLDMPPTDHPPCDEINKSNLESGIQNNQNNEETGGHSNTSRTENTDPQTENGENPDSEECHTGPEENSSQLSDDRMDINEPNSNVDKSNREIDESDHPLKQPSNEVGANSEKYLEVKSKKVIRLNELAVYPEDSLEHYLKEFFALEFLEKDYLCTICNPCLVSSDTNTDSDEDKDEKEDSTENTGLDTLHFSNAHKQFHIKTLPPILTIHLKRFYQSGYRFQKVNKHIVFPLVLDMSPFCLSDTSVPRDYDNQILYGLRGIVNHSGGMSGGHYVAYVNIADWNVPAKIPSKDISKSGTAGENEGERASKDQPMDTDPAQENEDSRMSLTSENCACKLQSQPTPTPDPHLYEHVMPTEEWYYISDSHMSRSDHDHVFSSQAYMLFYERLPLVTKDPHVL